MKRLSILIASLLLVFGYAVAQNNFQQLLRAPGASYGGGSTWAASATHTTEFVDMTAYDSCRVTFYFADSVDVDVYVLNYPTVGTTVADTSSRVDSVYALKAGGYVKTLSLDGFLNSGAGGFKLKLAFQASNNGSATFKDGVDKYFIYVKRFRSVYIPK